MTMSQGDWDFPQPPTLGPSDVSQGSTLTTTSSVETALPLYKQGKLRLKDLPNIPQKTSGLSPGFLTLHLRLYSMIS